MDNMKIKILFIALILFPCVNLFAENLLLNPGFELGNTGWFGNGVEPDTNPRLEIPYWVFWGTDGWCHNNVGTHFGTRAVLIWSDGPGLFQDIPVTEFTEYNFSVAVISPSSDANGLHGRDGLVEVEWLDTNKVKIYADEIGRFYGGLNDSQPIDLYDTWKIISGTYLAPSPAAYARVFFHLVSNDGSANGVGGVVSWDNFYAGTGSACPLGSLAGDVNNDCYVNFSDFADMALNWLQCNNVFDIACAD